MASILTMNTAPAQQNYKDVKNSDDLIQEREEKEENDQEWSDQITKCYEYTDRAAIVALWFQ